MAKKKKGKIRGFLKKTGQAVRKAAKAVGKAAKTAPLIPFIPMMKSALKKAGHEPKKGIEELANQFFSIVVKGRNSYDGPEHLVEDIVSIVKSILGFFKDKKERLAAKKAAGEPLTEGEENSLAVMEKIQSEAEAVAVDSAKDSAGRAVVDSVVDNKKPLMIGAAVLLIYFFFVKK